MIKTIKLTIFFLISILYLVHFPSNSLAIYNPHSVSNNKFGIHVLDTNDLEDAAKLVNTNGDWGYVTIVITNSERDTARWQEVFDKARRLHLIPIIRIATKFNGTNWDKPSLDEVDGWVSFLNSLNWVIKNRYIVVGNEPNHATEWGGEINPSEYSTWLKQMSQKLKSNSSDYFVIQAGFDSSAPSIKGSNKTMDEAEFIRAMLAYDSSIFDSIDGWSSHSYPNPNFSGSEKDTGRKSIKGFEWELNLLKSLGIKKDFPIFITETGWAYKIERRDKFLNSSLIVNKYKYAFESAWNNEKIVAITPFVLSYFDKPFDNFSWKNKDGKFNGFYETVKDLPKTKGEPLQDNKGEIVSGFIPAIYATGGEINGFVIVKNTGQAIWDMRNLSLLDGELLQFKHITFDSPIEPNQTKLINFTAEVGTKNSESRDIISLAYKGEEFGRPFSFFIFKLGDLKSESESFINKAKNIFNL